MKSVKINLNNTRPQPSPARTRLEARAQARATAPARSNTQVSTNRRHNSGFSRAKLVIAVIVVIGLLFLGSRWQRQVENSGNSADGGPTCNNILDPNCWSQALRPQLKQDDGKTNVLILGMDTRQSGPDRGLSNTDTLILGTLNHNTKQTRLLSFPRDLFVKYGCEKTATTTSSKINAVFAFGRDRCGNKGVETISNVVEKITGEKIQYTVVIRFEGVMEAIDAIGGVEIDIPQDHTDVYPVEDLPESMHGDQCKRDPNDWAFCIFTFKKGKTTLNGQDALIYARMRKWSTDFDRARRQQEVISAVKNKILGQDKNITEKASTLLTLTQHLSKFIDVNLDLETILAGLDVAGEVDPKPVSVILDPQFGGGGVIVKGQGSNYNFSDSTFANVKAKLEFIDQNIGFYKDNPRIYATNYRAKTWDKNTPLLKWAKDYWFVDVVTDTRNAPKDKYNTEVIDFTDGKMQATIDAIVEAYGGKDKVTVAKAAADQKPTYKEDIAVRLYSDAPPPNPQTTNTTK